MCIIMFSLLITAVILPLNFLVLILFYMYFLSLRCYFLYLNDILDVYVTESALKVPQYLCCFTISISLLLLFPQAVG